MTEPLPIDPLLPAIARALLERGAAVVLAPPGSGKTTRVPAGMLDLGVARRVVVLQPRRVAARLAAARVAAERGSALGQEVGYQVRFERVASARTRLEFLTEGLLTRRLQADPTLDGVDLVVLDEFHERSLDADLALAFLAEVRRELRPDLRLLVMSATLEPGPVAAFLAPDCPVIVGEGRRYEVEIAYDPIRDGRPLALRVAEAVRQVLGATTSGHVLAFLPGVAEIEATREALARLDLPVLALHGRLPAREQDRALAPALGRKVVLATNIAETSVTLDGVAAVVDSGLARVPRFDPVVGLSRLVLEPVPLDSAEQRAGRAGRTGPGLCRRLWTAEEHRFRPASGDAEVRRADLAPALLQVLAWGADPRGFRWFETPPGPALQQAAALLELIGATAGGRLTPVGRELSELPLHPRLGRVTSEGRRLGCAALAAAAAALASERDPWPDQDEAGFLARVRWVAQERGPPGDRRALEQVRAVRDQVLGAEGRTGPEDAFEEAIVRALLAGFPDRVGRKLEPQGGRIALAGGGGALLDRPETMGEFVLAVSLEGARRGLGAGHRVRLCVEVERAWLDLREHEEIVWSATSGATSADSPAQTMTSSCAS